jgi:NADH-quinone oxidoreductase subunit J
MNHGLVFQFHFYLFGILAVAGALVFVTRKSPVAAALWLVNVMFCISAMFLMLDAQFIAAIQVLVYAGAIMVVFMFVVMLLNLGSASDVADLRGRGVRITAGIVGLAMLADRDRRTALPRVSAAVRADQRAPPRRDRRRGGARQAEGVSDGH